MRTILVVDDDDAVRRVVVRSLEHSGFGVIEALHGQDALQRLRAADDVRAIVLDLRMPVMDGWAFRKQQRLDPSIAAIPIVVLSGADEERFHELDASAILRKPAMMSEIVAAVNAVIAV